MDDKTCGTCLHGLHNIVYCETNNPNANTAGLHGAGERACKRYSERTDSAEQVARDMLADLMLLANYGGDYPEEYVERLKALGVDV